MSIDVIGGRSAGLRMPQYAPSVLRPDGGRQRQHKRHNNCHTDYGANPALCVQESFPLETKLSLKLVPVRVYSAKYMLRISA